MTFKGVQLVDHFIALERSKQTLSVLRFIKLRICSVGSWSVALNWNVCQFHLAIQSLGVGNIQQGRWVYFPCDISQPQTISGKHPKQTQKAVLYDDEQFVKKWRQEILFIVILFSLSVKGSSMDKVHCLAYHSNKTSV